MKQYDNKMDTVHVSRLDLADDGFGNLVNTTLDLWTFNWWSVWNGNFANFY